MADAAGRACAGCLSRVPSTASVQSVCMCAVMHTWGSEDSVQEPVFSFPCVFWRLNLCHGTWQPVPLPAKPPHQPFCFTFKVIIIISTAVERERDSKVRNVCLQAFIHNLSQF